MDSSTITSDTKLAPNDVRNIYPSYNPDDPNDPLNRYKTLVEFAIRYKDSVLGYPFICKETREIVLEWLKH